MAAAAPTSTWTPPPGRHTVDLGSSLMRALKARQSGGDAQPMRSLHKKDFYSFRYNFKPGQVDSGARGKITTKRPKDSSSNVSVSVEHPSTRPGDVHLFAGEQQPSKDFDCVLIFDEASGTFTLEKLDSGITLNYLKKQSVGGKTVSPPPAPPVPDPNAMDIDQAADQLERDILSAAEGSDGEEVEIDQELFDEIIPKSFSRKSEQKPPSRAIPMEEEEEEEEIPIAVAAKVTKPPPSAPAPAPAAKPPKAAKPKLAKSAAKATPKAAAAAAAPAQPSPRTTAPAKSKVKPSPPQPAPPVSAALATPTPAPAKAKAAPVPRPAKKKREPEPAPAPPVSASMGEDIEIFSLPKPSKRPRVSPPPEPASEGWALPGATTAVSRPPPVAPPVSAASSSLPPPIAAAELEESDDEDDWDEVAAVDDPVPAPPDPSADASGVEDDFDIFGEAMKEDGDEDGDGDDHDLFANQLNQELGLTMEEDSDEDFLRDMVEEAPPSAVIPQREGLGAGPISLKALAGDGDDSEDYSSSDDSDDD